MDKSEMSDAIEAAVAKSVPAAVEDGVRRALLTIGIDISEPNAILESQKDFQHLRAFRQSTDAIKRHSLLAMAAITVSGVAGAIWLAIKSAPKINS
jgi:hypothetical protein